MNKETDERKARVLDAIRDAEMCFLQRLGKDKNPYRKDDPELEEEWDRVWELYAERHRLRSAVECLEEINRRLMLRLQGTKR